MVDRKALSIREEAAYSAGYASALRALRSAEVLRESVTDRISFSHNILFDYAVARLLLDEEEIFSFLNSDSSQVSSSFDRPFSTSFIIFGGMTGTYFGISHFDFLGRLSCPERAKVIPAIVVTEASRSLSDVEPALADQDHAKVSRSHHSASCPGSRHPGNAAAFTLARLLGEVEFRDRTRIHQ